MITSTSQDLSKQLEELAVARFYGESAPATVREYAARGMRLAAAIDAACGTGSYSRLCAMRRPRQPQRISVRRLSLCH